MREFQPSRGYKQAGLPQARALGAAASVKAAYAKGDESNLKSRHEINVNINFIMSSVMHSMRGEAVFGMRGHVGDTCKDQTFWSSMKHSAAPKQTFRQIPVLTVYYIVFVLPIKNFFFCVCQ